ncbi:hypothetical protein VSX64_19410 [Aurantimonas sp. C2-6-R+9]|uniref:hypothetical protein n=1 Tax=unclassified Aurantimonas TaxID=2638230 RepID=UPI002E19E272|nr:MULTISPECIES: hypothetical protein [unclassified Aurantimonas]MEC5292861.1 hypothetical protein [Aurantimonas sp. C2-3-R2]MEC5383007.1 hypothetical protein [Aurantimonas sp. C2-6-R+9]MEC5413861.1 hypothetical protein [Aurantimonas sp. C2-4-R8]
MSVPIGATKPKISSGNFIRGRIIDDGAHFVKRISPIIGMLMEAQMAGLRPQKRSREEIEQSNSSFINAHAAFYDDWLDGALAQRSSHFQFAAAPEENAAPENPERTESIQPPESD